MRAVVFVLYLVGVCATSTFCRHAPGNSEGALYFEDGGQRQIRVVQDPDAKTLDVFTHSDPNSPEKLRMQLLEDEATGPEVELRLMDIHGTQAHYRGVVQPSGTYDPASGSYIGVELGLKRNPRRYFKKTPESAVQ